MPLYEYRCAICEQTIEVLQKHTCAEAPMCHDQPMVKQFSTPAFTFTNGKGTSGGNTMRMAGRPVTG